MVNSNTYTSFARWLAAGLAVPGALAAVEIDWSASFANRYVAEGINEDPDSSGFLFNEVTVAVNGFTAGAWYAQSVRGSSTNEINLFAEYGFALGEVELFAGVNFLTFPAPDEPDTWELYFGFEYALNENLVFFGVTYYDIDEIRGGFIELGVAVPFAPVAGDDRWLLEPYAQLGVDYGYVSGPRSLRANNFQVGLGGAYALTDAAEIFAGVHHSFRLSNLRDEGEGDVSWAEVGFTLAF